MNKLPAIVQSCLRKAQLDEKPADKFINKAHKEGLQLYRYYCCFCGHWHLTKQKAGSTRRLYEDSDYRW